METPENINHIPKTYRTASLGLLTMWCHVNFGVSQVYSLGAMTPFVRNTKYTASLPAEGMVKIPMEMCSPI